MLGVVIAAWNDVQSRPLRTLASVAGMVAAVTAVVTVNAASILSNDAERTYLDQQFGKPATVEIRVTAEDNPPPASDAVSALVERALRSNGVRRLSRFAPTGAVLVAGDAHAAVTAAAVSPQFPRIRVVNVVRGEWPVDTANAAALHAVVDTQALEALGIPARFAVGRQLGLAFTGDSASVDLRTTPVLPVVLDAVMRDGDASSVGIFLAGDRVRASSSPRGGQDLVWLANVHPSDVGLVRQLVASVFLQPQSQGFQASVTRTDQDELLGPVLAQQNATARVVAWVALIVGALGLVGVGLAAVRERSRDYGLRRALGASRQTVFFMVCAQTLFEVLTAAVVAIPLSAVVVAVIPRRLILSALPVPAHAQLPLSSALYGLLSAAIVGFLAGLMPAVRAARLSVSAALRE
jgi:putative ABC transport system permease protein